jgi:hypothetical protein
MIWGFVECWGNFVKKIEEEKEKRPNQSKNPFRAFTRATPVPTQKRKIRKEPGESPDGGAVHSGLPRGHDTFSSRDF